MMDNVPRLCYTDPMSVFEENGSKFWGEQAIVLPTEAFQDYVEHPQVRRMYLTDVGFYLRARDHFRERKEGIEEYILIYCTEGSGVIWVEDREYHLHPNEAFCIPRFKGHRYWASSEDPWSILWVHFKGEDTHFFPLDKERVVKMISANASNRMMFLFELLFKVLNGNYTLGNFIYISQVLSLILAEIYEREKKDSTQEQNKFVTNVVRYMYRHIYENITLDTISEDFKLSKSYLNAIFQKYTRHSPMDFFINLKMKEACKMLRSSEMYIYEIAQKLGYSDQYYFSRIFKKVVGMSPKEYKNSDYFHYKE